jgi:predicted Co/Zn/Cd cation transporter (cation efflux family)
MVQPIPASNLSVQSSHMLCFSRLSRWRCSWVQQCSRMNFTGRHVISSTIYISFLIHIGISTTVHEFLSLFQEKIFIFLWPHPVKWSPLSVVREATRRTLQIKVRIKCTQVVSWAKDSCIENITGPPGRCFFTFQKHCFILFWGRAKVIHSKSLSVPP